MLRKHSLHGENSWLGFMFVECLFSLDQTFQKQVSPHPAPYVCDILLFLLSNNLHTLLHLVSFLCRYRRARSAPLMGIANYCNIFAMLCKCVCCINKAVIRVAISSWPHSHVFRAAVAYRQYNFEITFAARIRLLLTCQFPLSNRWYYTLVNIILRMLLAFECPFMLSINKFKRDI